MFYLEVIQDDKVIAQRQYWSAGECTEKLLVAMEYYIRERMEVRVRMLDARGMLIKELDRENLDELNRADSTLQHSETRPKDD